MKMKILYRRRFQKQLAKLQNRQKAAVADTIILNDYPLNAEMIYKN